MRTVGVSVGWGLLFLLAARCALADVNPFGVCAHLGGHEYSDQERELGLMQQAGIRWARADFSWGYFERSDNQWQFEQYDAIVAAAKQRNVTLLPILCYNVDWAFPAHDHLDQWCDYVRTVATRYKGDLKYWEVWNEPNIGFWKPEPNPEQYVRLLEATYKTIKEVDPALRVVYGGTAGVPFDYLRKTFEQGAVEAFDVLAVHPYQYPQVPEISALTGELAKTRVLLNEFGGDEKKVWITEYGWPTHVTPVVDDSKFLPQLIVYAAKLRFPQQSKFRAAVLHQQDVPFCGRLGLSVIESLNKRADVQARPVTLAELALLDPQDTQILVMPTGEHYPADYFDALLAFVRKGGLSAHLGGVPFYYQWTRKDGKWESTGAGEAGRAALHVGWKAWWTDKSVPELADRTELATPKESGIELPPKVTSTRWLTDAKLQGGDQYVPLLNAYDGDKLVGSPVALYLYDSDLKGAFLGTILDTNPRGVTDDTEALYLPRALLLSLGEGVEVITWYEFRDGGDDATYNEHRFGILHLDLSPKPAYRAYQALTKALGAGRFVEKLDVGEGNHCYAFDAGGTKTLAVWRSEGVAPVRLKLSGPKLSACDYLGDPVKLGLKEGATTVTASEQVAYLTGVERYEVAAK
ncbi:MAG: hypothetical protein COS65_09135 [Armatimonadetes bacterium CG06_land_8_20_14_3_00_66_21]|nr:MAG: hypothetical protein COS65_09135 [Armatimonadetes bacterium CG06_land_8_20_14_3_00_66_21]PIX45455.1 MAG: hypothetical protein COZ57_15380 [Armatimonadetes bacterium CG_4_8_14_3_um_filter_66_20]